MNDLCLIGRGNVIGCLRFRNLAVRDAWFVPARGYCGKFSSRGTSMPKSLRVLAAFTALLLITTEALAGNHPVEGRSPIIYNPNGNEVGVLTRLTPDGMAIMIPSRTTLGMGNYSVVLSQQNLKPRAKGGWE